MKILVGIDGSTHSMNATKYVARLASELASECSITLMSVHDNTALKYFKRYIPKGVIRDYSREMCENDLKKPKDFLEKKNVPHDVLIEFGQPVARILAISQKGAYDLIVLGTKGQSMINHLLLGSVAMRVAAVSKIPVTLIQ